MVFWWLNHRSLTADLSACSQMWQLAQLLVTLKAVLRAENFAWVLRGQHLICCYNWCFLYMLSQFAAGLVSGKQRWSFHVDWSLYWVTDGLAVIQEYCATRLTGVCVSEADVDVHRLEHPHCLMVSQALSNCWKRKFSWVLVSCARREIVHEDLSLSSLLPLFACSLTHQLLVSGSLTTG